MEHILNVEKREKSTKSGLKKLRRDGNIPAVVYGNNKDPITVSLNERAFRKQFSHISESTLISLKIDGADERTVLIKDFEQNLIRGTITHIDFYEISQGKSLTTNVGIHLAGSAPGVKNGGVLEHFMHEVEVESLPKDLPEEINFDISTLQIGDSLYVKDLPQLSGVTYRSPDESVVVHISAPKQASLVADTDDGIEEETEE